MPIIVDGQTEPQLGTLEVFYAFGAVESFRVDMASEVASDDGARLIYREEAGTVLIVTRAHVARIRWTPDALPEVTP